MRIAIDVRATQTAHRERGIGRSVFDLVRALAEHGGAHEYGLIHQRGLDYALADLPENFTPVPVAGPLLNHAAHAWPMRIPRLRSRPLGRAFNDRIMRGRHQRALEAAVRGFRPDVLHFAAPIDVFTDTEGDFGCRTVATFFDAIPRLDPASHYDGQPDVQRRQYDRQLAAIGRMDAVVAISNSSRGEAIRYAGVDPARCFTVHLAVPDDFACPTDAPVEAFTGGRSYFLFLSALDPHKNPLGVVRAFAQAGTGGRLVMLSSHRGPLAGAVRELAAELGISDDVTITDVVPDETLRALVQGATALVSPSFFEGFGLPAAQAMRAGVPVIASNRTSQPEVVGDAGIQVDPDDVDALAAAIAQLAGDPRLRADLSERGRGRAALFSYARLARNMVDVYEGRPPSDPVPGL